MYIDRQNVTSFDRWLVQILKQAISLNKEENGNMCTKVAFKCSYMWNDGNEAVHEKKEPRPT